MPLGRSGQCSTDALHTVRPLHPITAVATWPARGACVGTSRVQARVLPKHGLVTRCPCVCAEHRESLRSIAPTAAPAGMGDFSPAPQPDTATAQPDHDFVHPMSIEDVSISPTPRD